LEDLFGGAGHFVSGDRWEPCADVFETEDSLVVRVELPGVQGEDLGVRVDGDVLHISGVRSIPKEPGATRLHRMEIAFGPFRRVIKLPVPFDNEAVHAHLEDGFLRVVFPHRRSERRRITVETE